jgi:dethiobiotin synthetase
MEHKAKGFFITGTDTGVGKTIITAALIKVVSLLGYTTGCMKPVESGCKIQRGKGHGARGKKQGFRVQGSGFRGNSEKTLLMPHDGIFLIKIARTDDSIDLVTPLRFREPLAPLPASKIEGRPINIRQIKNAFLRLSQKYEALIVEGIGGLLVPLKRDYFVIDMAKDFKLPLIIVTRPSLGTINHTLLTVNHALREGLMVAGIVINYSQPYENTLAEATNPEIIRQVSPVPVIGILPYLKDTESLTIERAAVKTLDLEIIKKYL